MKKELLQKSKREKTNTKTESHPNEIQRANRSWREKKKDGQERHVKQKMCYSWRYRMLELPQKKNV